MTRPPGWMVGTIVPLTVPVAGRLVMVRTAPGPTVVFDTAPSDAGVIAVAAGAGLTLPVLPVLPEFPLVACGLAVALLTALPVSPVLVALDRELAGPEAPEVALAVTLVVLSPPLPPVASSVATP